MRINLVTPFAEKDAVKALGARWDAAKKIWYITDVADWHACFGLPQKANDLLFAVFAGSHVHHSPG
nr:DUF5710 domain-containing protein [Rhodoferax sp.]